MVIRVHLYALLAPALAFEVDGLLAAHGSKPPQSRIVGSFHAAA
jgi:hypothetical protein